jgi:hypothetical protein
VQDTHRKRENGGTFSMRRNARIILKRIIRKNSLIERKVEGHAENRFQQRDLLVAAIWLRILITTVLVKPFNALVMYSGGARSEPQPERPCLH